MKIAAYGEQNILAINMLEGIFYSADQLWRTKVLSTTRLNNTFTPAIFHSIYNLYCRKPHLHSRLYKREKMKWVGRQTSEHGMV